MTTPKVARQANVSHQKGWRGPVKPRRFLYLTCG